MTILDAKDDAVERVARAMGTTLIPGSTTITAELVMSRELIGRMARAAIEAMREPTPAIDAALSHPPTDRREP